jgi:hypothetical protein
VGLASRLLETRLNRLHHAHPGKQPRHEDADGRPLHPGR